MAKQRTPGIGGMSTVAMGPYGQQRRPGGGQEQSLAGPRAPRTPDSDPPTPGGPSPGTPTNPGGPAPAPPPPGGQAPIPPVYIPPPIPNAMQTAAPAGGDGQAPPGGWQAVYDTLGGLFGQGGQLNQDIMNRRMGVARSMLETARGGEMDTIQGQLGERGLLGSGPETEALFRHGESMGARTADAYSSIFADESERADSRLMQALGLGSGLSTSDADRTLSGELGRGQIDATNRRSDFDYMLGLGRLGYDYDALSQAAQQGDIDALMKLIEQLFSGASQGTPRRRPDRQWWL